MQFLETPIPGAYLIELEPKWDERGFFARMFCQDEFAEMGLAFTLVQCNTSLSRHPGTLRGLHYQLAQAAETKLIRCLRGVLWDCVLDLRPDSPTFGKHFGAQLDAENRSMMLVPKGCAHGFLTLEEDTEIIYFVDHPYSPELERGVRWDDPKFAITWPSTPRVISERDSSHLDFSPSYHLEGNQKSRPR